MKEIIALVALFGSGIGIGMIFGALLEFLGIIEYPSHEGTNVGGENEEVSG